MYDSKADISRQVGKLGSSINVPNRNNLRKMHVITKCIERGEGEGGEREGGGREGERREACPIFK